MNHKRKKRALLLCLVVMICGLFLYCSGYLYYKNYVWLPHLPDPSMIDYVEKEAPRTYYYLKMENNNYLYRMSFPSITGFIRSHCVFDAVSNTNYYDDDYVPEDGIEVPNHVDYGDHSKYAFTIACRLDMKGKIKFFGCFVDATCFWLSPDLELINEADLSDADMQLYQDAKPEMEALCKSLCDIFSLE